MKLKCLKSKTDLFKPGKTYDVMGSYHDDEFDEKTYIAVTEINSYCHVQENWTRATFKEIAADDVFRS